jgi:TalC/MipB family fructose-6-phosphate aldolase
MKIYGAGSLEDIKKCTELGVAGILTNPQGFDVYYKGEMTLEEITKAILDVSDSPVFIQVHGPNAQAIIERAKKLRQFSKRVNAKIIADEKGFEAIRILQREGIDCIATCLFSISQAAVASMVGAYGVCPFFSRAKEAGIDMSRIITGIKACYNKMEKAPEIFAVSLKGVADVNEAFAAGTDSVALRYPLLRQMMTHILTERAEALFAVNWARVKGEDMSYMKDKIMMEGVAE